MIISIVMFLLMEIGSWQRVSCSSIDNDANIVHGTTILHDKYDSMYDYRRDRVTRNSTFRTKRVTTILTSTESSIRLAYERTMNRTTKDYYAKRKAVLERYYARQREIINKFGKTTTTQSPEIITTMKNYPINRGIDDDDATTGDSSVEDTKNFPQTINNVNTTESTMTTTRPSGEIERNERGNNNSNVSWIYRLDNWNPKLLGNETDFENDAESSNVLLDRINKKEIPGYYRLGEFKGDNNERIIYQHNLGVGLRGSSRLEANFEVVLEGAFAITVIEAFPYANTRAQFSWISGGPGTNSVKLKLRGYENEGFSYTVKVWGVPV